MLDQRISESFTVLDGRLAAASRSSASKNAKAFRDAGFTHVLSLQSGVDVDAIQRAGLTWLGHLAIPDYKPATRTHRAEFYRILDALPEDARLLIHCTAGLGRSPMMVAIALVRKHGRTPAQATSEVQLHAQRMRGVEVIETKEQHQAIFDASRDP